MMDSNQIRAKHTELMFPCVANYYEQPIVLAAGKGTWVTDVEGRDYLDFFGGILTVSLGHCEPHVAEAVATQVKRLGHVSTLYPTENIVRAAERLARIAPKGLTKCFFTNSGTEADETAVVLAKVATGRQEIIALRHCYAGRSHLALSLCGHAAWRLLPSQVSGITHAPAPYCYRCPLGLSYPGCGVQCARDIEELIRTETMGKPAAFIAEPILGVGGFIVPPKEYFQVAVEIVRAAGGLFICDEVQTGFGRTGEHWFGIEHYGVQPDIMTMAKGIANGMPVGATLATQSVASAFTGLSICTFGGNPVSMAATMATLDVMEREDVRARAAKRGARLRDHLLAMQEKFPCIGDVRGRGLMLALELVEDRRTKEPAPRKVASLMEASKTEGLLLGKGGLHGNTIRIAPPMLVSDEEIDEACRRLDAAFSRITSPRQ